MLPATYFQARTIGRLKPAVTFEQASVMYRTESVRFAAVKIPGLPEQQMLRLQDGLAGPVRQAYWVMLGVMGFLLLIAFANLAHLLLSRTTERRQELAVRAELVASRGRRTRPL